MHGDNILADVNKSVLNKSKGVYEKIEEKEEEDDLLPYDDQVKYSNL
jgi:hypothetical protein